jgi:hypothetical protein
MSELPGQSGLALPPPYGRVVPIADSGIFRRRSESMLLQDLQGDCTTLV